MVQGPGSALYQAHVRSLLLGYWAFEVRSHGSHAMCSPYEVFGLMSQVEVEMVSACVLKSDRKQDGKWKGPLVAETALPAMTIPWLDFECSWNFQGSCLKVPFGRK